MKYEKVTNENVVIETAIFNNNMETEINEIKINEEKNLEDAKKYSFKPKKYFFKSNFLMESYTF